MEDKKQTIYELQPYVHICQGYGISDVARLPISEG